ncbi:MFS transporter [Janthinobacterium fluminis]|uniref:MFS transporter n=1 Tax=Janthinobacterium fluminis TaxID=2987524 RepID=A0ABT5K8F4_9BURK|nr:MFS transporter [Janthinobacterium fluminis]MDC8760723.1 MFS transporter [Janthinobacterium fluminis]
MSGHPTAAAPLMREANFRWLLAGAVISMLGDQFSVIALPWLVLKMTGDSLTLGLVIALMSVPRAVFILAGGALVDRHSPRRVLMLSKHANAILLGALAALLLCGQLTLPLVYALALGIGLASAFGIPSATALLPQVAAPHQLHQANGIMLGLRQLSLLAGPLLAGLLIALAGRGDAAAGPADARGLGLAFAFDCLTFVLSAWTLSKVRTARAAAPERPQAIWRAVGAGLAMVWRDRALRTCLLYWAAVSLLVTGPLQVALPVLASERLHGAAALGLLLGAHGAGTLLGMAASGVGGGLRIGSFGSTLLLIDAIVGALLMPLGRIDAAWQGALLLALVGALAGFMQIAVYTWIQRRVPPAMLGRAMSIFMFIFMGLAPLSAAAAGWLMQSLTLAQLFAGGGAMLIALTLLTFALTPMRGVTDAPPGATTKLESQ